MEFAAVGVPPDAIDPSMMSRLGSYGYTKYSPRGPVRYILMRFWPKMNVLMPDGRLSFAVSGSGPFVGST